jgi:GntR family transcriptional regulator / MocR family aminotransferase
MQRKRQANRPSPGTRPVYRQAVYRQAVYRQAIYRQVYERIRAEILSGRLVAGARLPSSRTLAAELGVARGTVVTAFQMLAGEGYTASAGARGTVVNVALPRTLRSRPAAELAHTDKAHGAISKPPAPLLFQVGLPALDAFPRKQWTQIAVRVARQFEHEQMVNPNLYNAMGYEPLRRAIASYLRIARDITCSANQVLITAGFQGALGLTVQALLKPGAKVLVEDPGYVFARNLLRQARLRLVGVRIDDGGFDVAAATRSAPDAALALVTPSHQYPLGMTLPIERRLALLDWADRERAWIVEDDYDCEFHHRGLPPPALKSLDRNGRVLYAGSFSKVLFPGLRLGYLVLPGVVAERFARVASAALPAPPIAIQKSVESFLSQGYFARHLSRMRTLYTERRKALAAAIESTMNRYVEIRLQDGGMHFVARLRGGLGDAEIVEHLRRKGIGPASLSRCSLKACGHSGLIIGYTNVAKEDAASATRRLLGAMQRIR